MLVGGRRWQRAADEELLAQEDEPELLAEQPLGSELDARAVGGAAEPLLAGGLLRRKRVVEDGEVERRGPLPGRDVQAGLDPGRAHLPAAGWRVGGALRRRDGRH